VYELGKEKPLLNYQKMKEKLGEILAKNASLIDNLKLPLKKLAVSMEHTAKQIILLYIKKFQEGEVRNNTVKFTYSYLCKSLGKGFRVPNVKTVIRHILRFLELPFKFITQKERSHIEEIGVNGVALTLHPSVIFYKNEAHQKAHEQGYAVMTNTKNKPLPPPKSQLEIPENMPPFDMSCSSLRRKNDRETILHTANSIGNVVNDIFKNLFQP